MFGKKATFEAVAKQLDETERLVSRIYTNTECKLAEEVLALLKQPIQIPYLESETEKRGKGRPALGIGEAEAKVIEAQKKKIDEQL